MGDATLNDWYADDLRAPTATGAAKTSPARVAHPFLRGGGQYLAPAGRDALVAFKKSVLSPRAPFMSLKLGARSSRLQRRRVPYVDTLRIVSQEARSALRPDTAPVTRMVENGEHRMIGKRGPNSANVIEDALARHAPWNKSTRFNRTGILFAGDGDGDDDGGGNKGGSETDTAAASAARPSTVPTAVAGGDATASADARKRLDAAHAASNAVIAQYHTQTLVSKMRRRHETVAERFADENERLRRELTAARAREQQNEAIRLEFGVVRRHALNRTHLDTEFDACVAREKTTAGERDMLHASVKETKATTKAQAAKIKSLLADLKAEKAVVAKFEKRQLNLRSQVDHLELNVSDNVSQIRAAEVTKAEAGAVRKELGRRDQEVMRLQQANDAAVSTNRRLEDRVRAQADELSRCVGEIGTLRATVARLEAAWSASRKETAAAAAANKELRTALRTSLEKRDDNQQKLETATAALVSSAAELSVSRDKANTLERDLVITVADAAERGKQLGVALQTVRQLKTERIKQDKRLETKEAREELLATSLAATRVELNATSQRLDHDTARLTGERDDARALLSTTETDLASLTVRFDALTAHNIEQTRMADATAATLQLRDSELETLTAVKEDAMRMVADLQQEVSEAAKASAELTEQVNSFRSKVEVARAQIKLNAVAAAAAAAEAKERLAQKQAHATTLQQQLGLRQTQLDDLRAQVRVDNDAREKLRQHITMLKQKSSADAKQLAKSVEDSRSARRDLASAQRMSDIDARALADAQASTEAWKERALTAAANAAAALAKAATPAPTDSPTSVSASGAAGDDNREQTQGESPLKTIHDDLTESAAQTAASAETESPTLNASAEGVVAIAPAVPLLEVDGTPTSAT
jgi:chromosome segregation ATPase